ncbi:MAG TPA: hypothetical protein VJ845_02785 [Haploplasma sp.]|nr:hypothetical protein [Haploplasma sp.]
MSDLFTIVVFILQSAMTLTVFVALPLLLVIRVITVIKEPISLKASLLTVLLPLSVGYFIFYNEDSKFFKLYKILIICFTALALLGIIYTIYVRYLT